MTSAKKGEKELPYFQREVFMIFNRDKVPVLAMETYFSIDNEQPAKC